MIALMPMKGHSERVSNKNMRFFLGYPLYRYVLKALKDSKYISQIVVNTDSSDIKRGVLKEGGEKVVVIDRPEKIRGDFVGMNDIIKYDLDVLGEGHYLQTHSTNPLLTTEVINDAIESYYDKNDVYDSLFTVNKIQSRLYDKNGNPVNHNLNELKRTQDLDPVYDENSNLYIFSKKSFVSSGNKRIGLKPQMFVMDKLDAIDIDEEEDFELAEILYKARKLG